MQTHWIALRVIAK